jgi:hypothetical protein
MARQRKPDEPNSVPTWIVSFSDMVTLLLAFFVLLQTFANVRDPDLFFVGQGSFRRAIAGLGLPAWLFGREDRPKRDFVKIKHPTDEGPPEHPKPKILDEEDEKIRKLFEDLKSEVTTIAMDLSETTVEVEATPIRFAASQAALDEPARAYLRRFAFDLRQTLDGRGVKLYVIGLAADAVGAREQWLLSARRAAAVEACLAELLASVGPDRSWSVYSWGGGPGGPWCRNLGIIPERSSIVLAVVREKS